MLTLQVSAKALQLAMCYRQTDYLCYLATCHCWFPIDRCFRTSLLGLVRLGIFERWVFLCRGPQPPEQETHGTDQDHAFTGVRPLLIILAITPVAAEPGKGALHYPADGERLESDRTRRPA